MIRAFTSAAAAVFAMSTMVSAASFSLDLTGAEFTSIPGGLEGDQADTPSNAILEELQLGFQDPGNNDLYTVNGWQGAQVLFSGGKVRVELMGWEAGFNNSFTLDGQTVGKGLNGLSGDSPVVASDVNTPLDEFVTGVLGAGVLDFSFISERRNGNPAGGVDNGSNPVTGQNFFVAFDGHFADDAPGATRGKTLWVFYDDSGVGNDNHDDLVIRISSIPLPAGAVLLLTGLGALAVRRRKAA